MPPEIVSRVIERLRNAMAQENASGAILVTRTNISLPELISEDDRVKIMTLRDFRNYLAHASRS
jgi:hypothetical protein